LCKAGPTEKLIPFLIEFTSVSGTAEACGETFSAVQFLFPVVFSQDELPKVSK
jgi:hypothetical protein